jgi:hypothetical protein
VTSRIKFISGNVGKPKLCSPEAVLESEQQNTATDEEHKTRTRMYTQLNNSGILVA